MSSPTSCSRQAKTNSDWAAEDLVSISEKNAKAQQCWGTALVGAAFRKLLRSCLNCHCEKVSKNRQDDCLKAGVKDLVRSTKSTDGWFGVFSLLSAVFLTLLGFSGLSAVL